MKQIILTLAVLLLSCINEKKEDKKKDDILVAKSIIAIPIKCEKCSIDICKKVLNDVKNEGNIKLFLCTFDKSCTKSAEFSEMSDEVIYLILQKNLITFLKLNEKNNISEDRIFDKISTPLLDYNYDSILKDVRKIKIYQSSKLKLIKALEKAKLGSI
jgi:hypothetical protein